VSFFGLFQRKPKYEPPVGDGRTEGLWLAGDLAVCISDGPWTEHDTGEPAQNPPKKGEVYRVSWVGFSSGMHVLELAERDGWYTARSFRKAVTEQDEACEPEFVQLLKRSKRKVAA
jgi:hypothetical protein